MSSAFDFLFQGSPPPSVTSSTTSQQGFPDWYQEIMRAGIGQAASVASQPYQPYSGNQLAGFTPAETSAFGMVQNNLGSQNPSLNQASGALGQVAQGFNANDANQYLAPYMNASNGLSASIQALGNQNLMQNILPGVNDAFTGAGQFGSTRNANFNSLAIQNAQMGISQAQGQAQLAGLQSGMSNYLQGQQNQNIAGQQLGSLGQIYQNTGLTDAAALQNVGQTEQQQNQSGLNVGYQNYLNQLNYPYNNVNFLNSQIRGYAAPTATNVTTLAPQSNFQAGQASPLAQGTAAAGGLGSLLSGAITPAPIIPGH